MMRTFFSLTLTIVLLLAGLLIAEPPPAAAQTEDISDVVTQEDLEDTIV